MLKRVKNVFVFFLLMTLVISGVSFAQNVGKVKGKVIDEKSKQPLPGVTITVDGTDAIAFTDENGAYELELPEGTYVLRTEFLGYVPGKAENVVVSSEKANVVNFSMKEAAAFTGEEVVVTGERLNVPLSRATASVSVESSKKFEFVSGAEDAGDLLKSTPGIQMESVGGAGSEKRIKIRGQGSPINNNRVLLLIDGVPAQNPRVGTADISDFPVEMIERIEVMKGAASAIYGGNAQSGVINIITKKGRKKPIFKFDMKVSTYQHRHDANQDWTQYYGVFHSWGGKNWDYSISGSYLFSKGLTYAETNKLAVSAARQGYIKVNYPGFPDFEPNKPATAPPYFNYNPNVVFDTSDLDDAENYNVNVNFGFKPFKGNQVRINTGYAFRHAPNFFGSFTVPSIDLVTRNRREWLSFTDTWEITPKLTYALKFNMDKISNTGDLFFFSSDYQSKRKAKYYARTGEDPQEDIDFWKATGVPLNLSPFRYFSKDWGIDNSITFVSDIFEPEGNSLTIGHAFRWEKVDLPPSKNEGLKQYLETPQHRKSTAIYFQDLQKIGKLNINIGGRWEQITHFIDDFDDEFSPRFAVNYEISPGTTLRASVGRAFRPPEYSHVYYFKGQGGNFFGNPELTYDIAWNYELGLKFLTKYVSGDIAYYYTKYSDQEVEVPLLAANPELVNLDNPKNVKFFKIYKKNREILGADVADAVNKVLNYYIDSGLVSKEEFIGVPRARTWINRGTAVYQGFDTSFDIENPWLPNLNLNLSYLFTRARAGNVNPFDFSQGGAPQPVKAPNFVTDARRDVVPLNILEVDG
ncbi:MAG: TonB-dependent receptor, partial [Candidatus Schekmanbacteria bacterium]